MFGSSPGKSSIARYSDTLTVQCDLGQGHILLSELGAQQQLQAKGIAVVVENFHFCDFSQYFPQTVVLLLVQSEHWVLGSVL